MKRQQLGEIEVNLHDWQLNLINRLMTEGFYDSQGEAVTAAIKYENQGDIDPQVQQRARELEEICTTAESSVVAHFFADTTELMHLYGKVAEEPQDEVAEETNSLYEIMQDRLLDPRNRDETAIEDIVDGVFAYVDELDSEIGGDTVATAKVNDYLEKYNPELVKTIL